MNTSYSLPGRRGRLALLVAVALAAASLTVLVDSGHAPSRSATTHDHSAATHGHAEAVAGQHKPTRTAFHDDMRKLWEDHVTWTRLAIVAFVDRSEGFPAAADRLLQNQADIGNAIKPFYGAAAGNQLTLLLRDHITIAVELLQAARAEDGPAFEDARRRWYANSDDIADFLAAANPRFWPRSTMRQMMRTHLDQTLAEASHELAGEYAASVADYDEIHDHILAMADVLSDGIIRAFPQRFR